jgi:hypothetical protein
MDSRLRVAVRERPAWVEDETGDAIVWSARSGRYVRLSRAQMRLLRNAMLADGLSLAELAALNEDDTDLTQLEELQDLGLVATWDEQDGIPLRRRTVAEAAMLNMAARAALRVCARPILRRLVVTQPTRSTELNPWLGWENEQLVAAARIAAALPGVDGGCLPMAVTLWLMSRRRGGRPQLRLGATVVPFSAHAWVEVDGVRLDIAHVVFPGRAFTGGAVPER